MPTVTLRPARTNADDRDAVVGPDVLLVIPSCDPSLSLVYFRLSRRHVGEDFALAAELPQHSGQYSTGTRASGGLPGQVRFRQRDLDPAGRQQLTRAASPVQAVGRAAGHAGPTPARLPRHTSTR